jgi:hypothetical protein
MKCLRCGADPATVAYRRTRRNRVWAVPAVVGSVIAVVLLAVVGLPRLLSPHARGDSTISAGQAIVPSGPERLARYAPMGREVQDADLAFTISAVDCGATTLNGPVTRTAQGQFCFVTLNVKNDGRAPATFIAGLQLLMDRQNRRFGPDLPTTTAHPANTGHDVMEAVVNPGNDLDAVLVFDVPPDAQLVAASLRQATTGPGAFVDLTHHA